MRRVTLLSLAAAMAVAVAVAASPLAVADVTRTVRGELRASPGERVGVENLAGTMRIVPGSGSRIEIVATVHAESSRLADSISIEEARGQDGRRVLRVEYPIDEHTVYRYRGRGDSDSGWFGLFGGDSNTTTKYAGRRIKISSSRGVELYADLEVRVPSSDYDVSFRNVAGDITASDLDGDFGFDTGSGGITLDHLRGSVSADTGSGTIDARELSGRFSGDTGSGDILLRGFDGESISCDTGSGNVEIESADADRIALDTGSGSILAEDVRTDKIGVDTGSGSITVRGGRARIVDADTGSGRITIVADGVERFVADTGSGDVTLETDGQALESVDVDTGSGDAKIRMGSGVTFHAMADQSSGSIRNGFDDARPIIRDREVVGYRRGDERVRITFETGSGSLILEPM